MGTLPRFVVPSILGAIAVLVLVLYAYPNSAPIHDEPEISDEAYSTVSVAEQEPDMADSEQTGEDGPKHYTIVVSDSPSIED